MKKISDQSAVVLRDLVINAITEFAEDRWLYMDPDTVRRNIYDLSIAGAELGIDFWLVAHQVSDDDTVADMLTIAAYGEEEEVHVEAQV